MSFSPDQEMLLWKYEPVSRSGTPSLEIDDDWPLFEDQSVEASNNAVEAVMYEDHPSRAQVAKQLLEKLDEWIKEEPFSDWLEEKIDLPIFEQISLSENQNKSPLSPVYTSVVYPIVTKTLPQQQQQEQQHDNTQTLLQEFETVLGDVEACHQIVPPTSSTLTPPQSPPHKSVNVDTQLLVTLQPMQSFTNNQPIYNIIPTEQSLYVSNISRQWNTDNIDSLSPLGGDVANELAVVDEYVRSHTKDIPSPISPCSSNSSSTDDSIDDPDWSLETEKRTSLKQTVHDSSKHRHKPYSRSSLEDKKVRKKEQNKNAATRYRQKKKQEIKEIQGEERELMEHNEELKEKMKNLQQEIKYLKGFMRDVFKAKGVLE
ncbi:PREDICTED: activating transcription factor of chaperone isoform X1 [Cyphomyrmex costatus]|uniref:Activating transcription factor of chaperone n=1 Tax=Cyphomyrmex costatus TaxID=456900 RepID=A0A195CJW7_9HYME|nr:PREDICTED: activating transcription factor of chaperone isoform X1 [Cyphomyrmex costatus]KYN01021.1 Activating transcription factor of chaperone [Cyphomyrmex costatus]